MDQETSAQSIDDESIASDKKDPVEAGVTTDSGSESGSDSSSAAETGSGNSAGTGLFSAWMRLFKSRGLMVVLGFLISAVFFAVIVNRLHWDEVQAAFGRAVWLPWLPAAVTVYIMGMLMRGVRLQLLVKDESSISVGTASNIVAVGYVTNNILPLRLGEFARAGMLAERTGLPYILALTITFLERLLDGLVIIFLFVAGSFFIPLESTNIHYVAAGMAVLFLVAIIVVAFVTLSPQSAIALASNLTHFLGRKWHHRALGLVTQINRAFSCLRDAQSALMVLGTSFLVWILEAAFFMLVMPCFGLPLGFIRAVVTMSATNLGILAPSSPGFIGVYHLACQTALVAVSSVSGFTPGTVNTINIDPATALSYAVVVHFVFFATVTIWGLLALARYGFEVGSTQALAWEARPIGTLPEPEHQSMSVIVSYPGTTAPAHSKLSEFWSAICECFTPEPDLIEDPGLRAEVHEEVGRFTCEQIDCIPFRYRLLFKVGLVGFKLYIFACTGKFLCSVPLARRRKLIEFWAFGPIGLTRKFMKLIRSLAILAYYDHEAVQAVLFKGEES